MTPHWHPEDENITVLKGTFFVGVGEKFDPQTLQRMGVGDFVLLPKKMLHFVQSQGETIVQVHGIGPFQILAAADDQRFNIADPKAAHLFRHKVDERVRTAKGEGIIIGGNGARKSNLVQYRIRRADGAVFWAVETEIQPTAN